MQAEEPVEVDGAGRARGTDGPRAAQRLRDRDVGMELVVRALAVWHHHVQRVGRAALEQANEHLALLRERQVHAHRGAAKKRRAQAHRDERDGTRLHELSTMHGYLRYFVKYGA